MAAIGLPIRDDPAIMELLNVVTVHAGPPLMVAAKLRLREEHSIEDACKAINELEVQIEERFPDVGWCFMEPKGRDGAALVV